MPDQTFEMSSHTTSTFGRVLCSARHNHFIVDGPPQIGCPGEASNPVEVFLAGIAACGAELIEVMAKEYGVRLDGVSAMVEGTLPAERIRDDVSIFSKLRLRLEMRGVGDEDARRLVERNGRGRDPDVEVEWTVA